MMHQPSRRQYLLWALIALAVAIGAYYLYQNVRLAGPERFSIATGRPGGAYYAFTESYAQHLATDHGVTLDLVETAGSVETLDLLLQREVPVGLVQSGTVGDIDSTELYSLGSLFYEPIWIFYRNDRFEQPLEYLYDLEGRPVGIGEAGSGTNLMARQMLADNELDEHSVAFHEVSTPDAYDLLTEGQIDAAFFVLAPHVQIVLDLLTHPDLSLMNLRRAGAYEARYPYLTEFAITEGTVDLRRNIPDEDKTILATTGMLVANELLHADSARQLLTAALDVHGGGDYLAEEGEFPSAQNSELAVPYQIEQFLELGPSDLEEYLPVNIATLIQRLVFVVLPLLILLYPLLRSTPGAYSFANRYRVYRWYQRLRRIESGLESYTLPELEEYIQELQELEDHITEKLRIPLFYQRDFYNLRLHLQLVIQRFEKRRDVLFAQQNGEEIAEIDDGGIDDIGFDERDEDTVILTDEDDDSIGMDVNETVV